MDKHTLRVVRESFEAYIRAYNTDDEAVLCNQCMWPYTSICGNEQRVYATCNLAELKHSSRWQYQQIISLNIVSCSAHTAHLAVRLVGLDQTKKPIRERDVMYIYKKVHNEWKILIESFVDCQLTELIPQDIMPEDE